MLDEPHHRRKVGPRIEQQQRGFERIGVGAFLDHAGALAVVLADDDQRAADHARRGQVRQRVGRHVGADDALPRDRAAQRVVDRGAEHRRRRGFVRAGFDVHAERVEVRPRLHHHVEQVRDRRALVAADVGHARLQQRLGDREDALAMEGGAGAEFQAFDLVGELDFHVAATVGRWLLMRPCHRTLSRIACTTCMCAISISTCCMCLPCGARGAQRQPRCRHAGPVAAGGEPCADPAAAGAARPAVHTRTPAACAPTPKADQLARQVEAALQLIDVALHEADALRRRPLAAPLHACT